MSFFRPSSRAASELIARTGFYTSLFSYIVFLLSDALRPGFVARYVSPHLCLLGVLGFGIWWMITMKTYRDRVLWQWLGAMLSGLILAVVLWSLGEGFGAYRILMTIIGFTVPGLLLILIRTSREA